MAQKRTFDANTIRLTAFIIGIVLLVIVNFISTAVLLKKSNSSTEEQYFESCHAMADGYAEVLSTQVQVFKTALDAMHVDEVFVDFKTPDFVKFFNDYKSQIYSGFKSVYFIDRQGMAWFPDGKKIDVSSREIYQQIIHGDNTEWINDPVITLHPETPEDVDSKIVIFGKATFNREGQKTGIICGSVKLTELLNIVSKVEIGKSAFISVQNKYGHFIVHPQKEYLDTFYNPADLDFTKSTFPLKIYSTVRINGDKIYLFPRHIENTSWTMSMFIPQSVLIEIHRTQKLTQGLIILISCVLIALVIFAESKITTLLQKKLLLSSTIDSVTGFYTKEYFDREARKYLLKNRRSKLVLIEADISAFKYINQKYGESAGTKVLIYFSQLLNELSTQFQGVVCRGHADVFYGLYKVSSVAAAMNLFSGLIGNFEKKCMEHTIPFHPKFGLAFYLPGNSKRTVSIRRLIDQATVARNTTKNDTLKTWAVYNSRIMAKELQKNYIESYMEKALQTKEFYVVYQPKMDLSTNEICGAEALVRWQSEELGFMRPDEFIPIFEQNNFIIRLDFFVYEQVFKFLRQCMDNNLKVVPVSLNMSRNHDRPDKYIHDIKELMARYNISTDLIEIEVVERSTQNKNLLRDFTLALQNEGFKVAMDDFGSGESSLNMLSTIPVDILKYDRSFLLNEKNENIVIEGERSAFIETLVNLGKSLNKNTIFEGVETKEQADFLKSIGCAQIQGYYYSKPLSQEDFIAFLNK